MGLFSSIKRSSRHVPASDAPSTTATPAVAPVAEEPVKAPPADVSAPVAAAPPVPSSSDAAPPVVDAEEPQIKSAEQEKAELRARMEAEEAEAVPPPAFDAGGSTSAGTAAFADEKAKGKAIEDPLVDEKTDPLVAAAAAPPALPPRTEPVLDEEKPVEPAKPAFVPPPKTAAQIEAELKEQKLVTAKVAKDAAVDEKALKATLKAAEKSAKEEAAAAKKRMEAQKDVDRYTRAEGKAKRAFAEAEAAYNKAVLKLEKKKAELKIKEDLHEAILRKKTGTVQELDEFRKQKEVRDVQRQASLSGRTEPSTVA